ncbi:peptidoglycan-associated lipoprotein Pal [Pikeienuella piscinae]|nr:peptidoglycan-associated lipoprotein Pal [Pikeienuella piscinae]
MINKLTTTIAFGAALMLAACTGEPPDAEAPAPGGAPTSTLDPASVAYFQQTVGDRVFFETDSTRLTQAGQQTLIRQAEWLAQNPGVNAVIEGHADERGTREYNLALGARRAEAARSYLAAQGVAASRLSTISYGKERPEALCSAESCWSENRRAVTVIAGAPTS